ncbi:glutamate-cysteine ligase family protein [Sodalinema gerasimenkoae]|uniref:glutamate-cysteine ligase family protein n=1 Tax=Sodalinema gerasimenkoae TaxID=2862348 RepID=UPI003CCE368D
MRRLHSSTSARLIRVEAPLYLALSASSPFLDGELTGYDSTRWSVFPQVPQTVPLFGTHWLRLHSLVCLSPGSANGSPI